MSGVYLHGVSAAISAAVSQNKFQCPKLFPWEFSSFVIEKYSIILRIVGGNVCENTP